MMDFFKSRFFIVALIIALALVIVPSVLNAMGQGVWVRNAVNTALIPAQKLFGYVTSGFDGFVSYFTEYDRLKEENAALKAEISELKDKVWSAEELVDMNNWLYRYLELKREHVDYSLLPANIVGREAGNYMTVFTMDRGSSHGVAVDMPVVDADGVVGYIAEVGSGWCKAVSILETASAIGAYVERSGELGLIEGDFDLAAEGVCEMRYLPADADVAVGDRVLSSGLGSVYPRGLVIGEVIEVYVDKYSQSKIARVKPAADMSELTKVMIITGYDEYTE